MRPNSVNVFSETTPTGRKSKRDINATSWSKLIKRNYFDWSEIEEGYECDQLGYTHQEKTSPVGQKSKRDINATSWC